jgi:NTP pyrophosphatase (non-canonical NTP hydrolase)
VTGKSLADMTAEIRENNIEKGWRSAEGGPGDNTFGDYIALLHSEISEALEAYRDHRMEDATGPGAFHARDNVHILPKPEGVGSEFADILIRLLDMCDIFEIQVFDMDMELGDVAPVDFEMIDAPEELDTFGDHMSWLHLSVTRLWGTSVFVPHMLRALVTVAEKYGVDLAAECERKIAYNRTRSFQHGGRTLAGEGKVTR